MASNNNEFIENIKNLLNDQKRLIDGQFQDNGIGLEAGEFYSISELDTFLAKNKNFQQEQSLIQDVKSAVRIYNALVLSYQFLKNTREHDDLVRNWYNASRGTQREDQKAFDKLIDTFRNKKEKIQEDIKNYVKSMDEASFIQQFVGLLSNHKENIYTLAKNTIENENFKTLGLNIIEVSHPYVYFWMPNKKLNSWLEKEYLLEQYSSILNALNEAFTNTFGNTEVTDEEQMETSEIGDEKNSDIQAASPVNEGDEEQNEKEGARASEDDSSTNENLMMGESEEEYNQPTETLDKLIARLSQFSEGRNKSSQELNNDIQTLNQNQNKKKAEKDVLNKEIENLAKQLNKEIEEIDGHKNLYLDCLNEITEKPKDHNEFQEKVSSVIYTNNQINHHKISYTVNSRFRGSFGKHFGPMVFEAIGNACEINKNAIDKFISNYKKANWGDGKKQVCQQFYNIVSEKINSKIESIELNGETKNRIKQKQNDLREVEREINAIEDQITQQKQILQLLEKIDDKLESLILNVETFYTNLAGQENYSFDKTKLRKILADLSIEGEFSLEETDEELKKLTKKINKDIDEKIEKNGNKELKQKLSALQKAVNSLNETYNIYKENKNKLTGQSEKSNRLKGSSQQAKSPSPLKKFVRAITGFLSRHKKATIAALAGVCVAVVGVGILTGGFGIPVLAGIVASITSAIGLSSMALGGITLGIGAALMVPTMVYGCYKTCCHKLSEGQDELEESQKLSNSEKVESYVQPVNPEEGYKNQEETGNVEILRSSNKSRRNSDSNVGLRNERSPTYTASETAPFDDPYSNTIGKSEPTGKSENNSSSIPSSSSVTDVETPVYSELFRVITNKNQLPGENEKERLLKETRKYIPTDNGGKQEGQPSPRLSENPNSMFNHNGGGNNEEYELQFPMEGIPSNQTNII